MIEIQLFNKDQIIPNTILAMLTDKNESYVYKTLCCVSGDNTIRLQMVKALLGCMTTRTKIYAPANLSLVSSSPKQVTFTA